MISIKCPHCNVGLKVDENKLPAGISSFKCPRCKQAVPVSLLGQEDNDPETLILMSPKKSYGKLTVLPNGDTPEQVIPLYEGMVLIGRKSDKSSPSVVGIITSDKSMSREHARIEVKKDPKGGYKHYLSDNNSKNHTLYNSNYLGNGEVVVLNDNDEIILGHTILRFNE